ncbi:MAG: hypothetical protein AAGG01_07775 [Planctomycetota bacterium]
MGFNTQLRKARDDGLSPQRRFVALRGAVERFSPNGFNATFANLQQAVGVGDPDNWAAAEIAQAAALLARSRTHYMQHRARWDDDRRARKARGLHVPSREDSDTFNDRSWFDDISFSPRGRHRWVRLDEWVRANGMAPTAFGSGLEDELRETLDRIPRTRFEPMGSMLAHYGPFPSPFEPANVIAIPYRVYNDPIADSEYPQLSSRQQLIADCWYSRSHDGHVRERHLRRIIAAEEHWVVPYVLAALGDYVIEIVTAIEHELTPRLQPGSWHDIAYRHFATNNHDFIKLASERATSYWNCYHSASHARSGGDPARPLHPTFAVLNRLTEADAYPRRYRLAPHEATHVQRAR